MPKRDLVRALRPFEARPPRATRPRTGGGGDIAQPREGEDMVKYQDLQDRLDRGDVIILDGAVGTGLQNRAYPCTGRVGRRRAPDAPLHRAPAARDLHQGRYRRPDDQHILVGPPQPGAARPRGPDDGAEHPRRHARPRRAGQDRAGSARVHRRRGLQLRARDGRGAAAPGLRTPTRRTALTAEQTQANLREQAKVSGRRAWTSVAESTGAWSTGSGSCRRAGDGPAHLDRHQVPGRGRRSDTPGRVLVGRRARPGARRAGPSAARSSTCSIRTSSPRRRPCPSCGRSGRAHRRLSRSRPRGLRRPNFPIPGKERHDARRVPRSRQEVGAGGSPDHRRVLRHRSRVHSAAPGRAAEPHPDATETLTRSDAAVTPTGNLLRRDK